MPIERLQKIIAAAGVASRRKAEELITSGRVQVNGTTVTELGTKADSEQDHIRVDGKLLKGPERHTYIVLNKPKGYVTTVSDPENRPTVMDLVGGAKARVYPVGRLDWASEGLLLLTNDGELANGLMKASSNVPKIYVVKVAGQPDEAKIDKLRAGVSIAEKGGRRVRTAPAKIRQIRESDNPWFEVTIVEGRNRQVRKMFEEVGHHVEKIRRVQYGPLALDVPPGEFRSLTLDEVSRLKAAASGKKMFSAPREEVMPTVRPQPVKPPADIVSGTEAERQPIAKIQFRATPEAPRYSIVKAPFRPKTEGRPRPEAKSQYRTKSKAPFQSRTAKPYKPRDTAPFQGTGKPTQRPRSDDRPRGNNLRFDRGPARPASFRGAPRPPFRQRKPFDKPGDATASAAPGAGRSFDTPRSDKPRFERPRSGKPRFEKRGFDKPRSGTGFGGPKARRPFDKSSDGAASAAPSAGRPLNRPKFDRPRPEKPRTGVGFGGPKGRRPFDKSKPASRDGRRGSGARPSRPRGPRS
ncbi:MAG TPA: pseudouridine synthase [Terriglobales bacterium]|jgi:23S rRNA pseudouridine2605 synthase|nr:pseudouridine synthase [Terriglobales bacterium]